MIVQGVLRLSSLEFPIGRDSTWEGLYLGSRGYAANARGTAWAYALFARIFPASATMTNPQLLQR
jgi:hypothetical protein